MNLERKEIGSIMDGLLLPEDYLEKRREDINSSISKLKQIIKNKLLS